MATFAIYPKTTCGVPSSQSITFGLMSDQNEWLIPVEMCSYITHNRVSELL